MLTKVWVTGDTHGDFSRFKSYPKDFQDDPNAALIILGDAGFNYTLDENDTHRKNAVIKRYKFRIYCVRGNHEARPQDVGMQLYYDPDVEGMVYYELNKPQIRYFRDFGIYYIQNMRVAVIGGAYSVDKYYRLRGKPDTTDEWTGWFKNEQLSKEERAAALQLFAVNNKFDLVLSHTCPLEWEPTDLFLGCIDQSTVDTSMECWLNQVKNTLSFKYWLFGHFHGDRMERPGVEMLYYSTEDLNEIKEFWDKYNAGDEATRYSLAMSNISPNFYQK